MVIFADLNIGEFEIHLYKLRHVCGMFLHKMLIVGVFFYIWNNFSHWMWWLLDDIVLSTVSWFWATKQECGTDSTIINQPLLIWEKILPNSIHILNNFAEASIIDLFEICDLSVITQTMLYSGCWYKGHIYHRITAFL